MLRWAKMIKHELQSVIHIYYSMLYWIICFMPCLVETNRQLLHISQCRIADSWTAVSQPLSIRRFASISIYFDLDYQSKRDNSQVRHRFDFHILLVTAVTVLHEALPLAPCMSHSPDLWIFAGYSPLWTKAHPAFPDIGTRFSEAAQVKVDLVLAFLSALLERRHSCLSRWRWVGWDSSLAEQFHPGSCSSICRLPEGVLPAEESDADVKEGGEHVDTKWKKVPRYTMGIPISVAFKLDVHHVQFCHSHSLQPFLF